MAPPNLFRYATKELSQDAMICWLIDWAGFERPSDPGEEKLTRLGWEGIYQYIGEQYLDGGRPDDNWGALTTAVGGYTGLWVEPKETSENSRFAMWIEENRISVRLYGAKTKVSVKGMHSEVLGQSLCRELRRPVRQAAATHGHEDQADVRIGVEGLAGVRRRRTP